MNIKTLRQAWLMKAINILRHDFSQIGETFPEEIHILVEYHKFAPPGWLGSYVEDGDHHSIYISPIVDGLVALVILVHELIHASVQENHSERFYAVSKAIGLNDGALAGPEEVLLERFHEVEQILGMYPEEA